MYYCLYGTQQMLDCHDLKTLVTSCLVFTTLLATYTYIWLVKATLYPTSMVSWLTNLLAIPSMSN